MKRTMQSILVLHPRPILFLLILFIVPLYAYGSNDNLSATINKAIFSRYDLSQLNVSVNDNGFVTIRGDVNSLYDKYRIYEIVSRVQGVKKIINNITVSTDQLPADMIKANIRNMIEGSNAIKEPDKINIEVVNSAVKLTGNVNFYREKVAALSLAAQTDGVTEINDDITVTPIGKAVNDSDIHDYLNSILKNEFPLVNPKDIQISVDEGFVTIEGAVSNLWTKEKIEQEFSDVSGVIRVINNLEVNPDLANS